MSITSAGILLFLVFDPFGNIPIFLSALEGLPRRRRWKVVARELLIALAILAGFLFVGPWFLRVLHISESALGISGGVILFLIALKMIFGGAEQMYRDTPEGEPLIVPLAVPCVAGPSAAATVLLLVGQEPGRRFEWLLALCLAWGASAGILLLATKLADILGRRGLIALQRLMGLILTAIAVEMLLQGLQTAFQ